MAKDKYILVRHYSKTTHIDDSFLRNLHEYGLVTLEERENEMFINEKDISDIEKFFRLHRDLGINYEGLDAIGQMLKRIRKMEKEMNALRKKLRLYE